MRYSLPSLLALVGSAAASPLQIPLLRSAPPTSAADPSPVSISQEHGNSTAGTAVRVALGVMSRCPDASLCETVWDRVLEERLPSSFGVAGVIGDLVDLELVFIAHENSSARYGATCMHGELECRGNVQQLCAARHWHSGDDDKKNGEEEDATGREGKVTPALRPKREWTDWWNFVQCMNYGDRSKIGSDAAAEQCAAVVGREWNQTLAECVEGKEGRQLLVESVRRAKRLGVERSCTILLEDKPICVHDGTWKACPGGHEVRDFAREVRTAYERLHRRREGTRQLLLDEEADE